MYYACMQIFRRLQRKLRGLLQYFTVWGTIIKKIEGTLLGIIAWNTSQKRAHGQCTIYLMLKEGGQCLFCDGHTNTITKQARLNMQDLIVYSCWSLPLIIRNWYCCVCQYQQYCNLLGNFGSSVASFFTFLRWLCAVNLGLTILMVSFLLIPQVRTTNRQTAREIRWLIGLSLSLSYRYWLVMVWKFLIQWSRILQLCHSFWTERCVS